MTKFEQLVPVNVDSPDRITVSARDLHAALEVETPFNKWSLSSCSNSSRKEVQHDPLQHSTGRYRHPLYRRH